MDLDNAVHLTTSELSLLMLIHSLSPDMPEGVYIPDTKYSQIAFSLRDKGLIKLSSNQSYNCCANMTDAGVEAVRGQR